MIYEVSGLYVRDKNKIYSSIFLLKLPIISMERSNQFSLRRLFHLPAAVIAQLLCKKIKVFTFSNQVRLILLNRFGMTVSSHASYFEFDAWLGERHHPLNCCYTTENNDFSHHHYVCKPQLSFSLKCSSEQGLSEV